MAGSAADNPELIKKMGLPLLLKVVLEAFTGQLYEKHKIKKSMI